MGSAEMIVLDTHIWLWWINNDLQSLGSIRQEQIVSAEKIAVSAISCFEVAWLERHRRISLPCQPTEWFEKALSKSGIELLPITPTIATRAVYATSQWTSFLLTQSRPWHHTKFTEYPVQ